MPSSKIAKNSFFLYIRMLLILGVSLYTSKVILNVLGASDYGTYNVVGGVVSMFGFFNMAMTSATQRFLSYEIGLGKQGKLNETFSASLAVHLGIALLVMLFAETVGLWFVNNKLNINSARMDAVNWVYQFTILTFMVNIMRVPYNAMMIASERMKVYAILSMAEVILKLVIVYLLLISAFDKLKLYATLVFLITSLISLLYRQYCLFNFKESKFHFSYNKQLYRKLLSFSGWSLLGNLAVVARGQGSNILLNILFGTLVNAAYGITTQVSSAVKQFVSSFQTALNPQIVKTYAQGDLTAHRKLVSQGAKLSYFLLFIIVCPIWLNIEFILDLWLKEPPKFTSIFIRLALINMLIDSISGPMMISTQATGKIKWYQIVTGCFILLDLPISYFVLATFKRPEYSFIVTTSITAVSLFIRLLFLRSMVSLRIREFFVNVLLRLIAVTLLSVGVTLSYTHVVNISNDWAAVIVSFISLTLANLLLISQIGLDKSERNFAKDLILKKMSRQRRPVAG